MIEPIKAYSVGGNTYASIDAAKSAALLIEAGVNPSGERSIPVDWLTSNAAFVIDVLRLGTKRASSKAGRPRKVQQGGAA